MAFVSKSLSSSSRELLVVTTPGRKRTKAVARAFPPCKALVAQTGKLGGFFRNRPCIFEERLNDQLSRPLDFPECNGHKFHSKPKTLKCNRKPGGVAVGALVLCWWWRQIIFHENVIDETQIVFLVISEDAGRDEQPRAG